MAEEGKLLENIRARITVYPRPDILDPQGKAIGAALGRLGFRQVHEVRAGKSFDVQLEGVEPGTAGDVLEKMSRELLANPVTEDFTVDVLETRAVEDGV